MKSTPLVVTTIAACLFALGFGALPQGDPPGYDDTPLLPGQEWRVHDRRRPRPAVVSPAPEPGAAPSDAQILFDGSGLERWTSGGGDARWEVEDGALRINGTGNIATRDHFGDLQLHVEWAAPSVVEGESQGRGNSGVFLMGRYEIQVLDSFRNESYADGQAAALYGQYPPAVNASRGPGEWQTYDIFWKAPRFDGEMLASPGVVTVVHNGVVVHHARELMGASAHRTVAEYAPHPSRGPIVLQDHGNPVRYRNIWVREL